ncbi:MAG: DUF4334 domain-containing protein [Syntrophaceae bacterium]|nr:DUF4334 domain-containing protein [Syntrophaceae bacterium]
MTTFSIALEAGRASTDEALAIFDSLDPVDTDFMLGAWKGVGFPTGHPLDGLLEAYHWHGKRFESPEHVHPLVFSSLGGGTTSVNPIFMIPALLVLDRLPFLKSQAVGRIFQACIWLFSTSRSRARLRMMSYRGKSSATMIYDHLPINDVFRKLDENTVLGVMDLKGMRQPFFFVLRRENNGG